MTARAGGRSTLPSSFRCWQILGINPFRVGFSRVLMASLLKRGRPIGLLLLAVSAVARYLPGSVHNVRIFLGRCIGSHGYRIADRSMTTGHKTRYFLFYSGCFWPHETWSAHIYSVRSLLLVMVSQDMPRCKGKEVTESVTSAISTSISGQDLDSGCIGRENTT